MKPAQRSEESAEKTEMNPEENQWQPVRIVSFDELRKIHPMGDVEMQKRNAGRIVRVRPEQTVVNRGWEMCSGQRTFLIHKDDAELLMGYRTDESIYICE